jgi:flavodoxin
MKNTRSFEEDNMSKTLIAYFSAQGSTAKLAKTLAAAAEAELYEIKPAVPYERRDLNWMDKKSRTTLEMQDPNCRPALADTNAPVAESDVIFLGFPIWWYREPSIIDSFLDAYDWAGKTVVPFFTSGGSDLGEGQDRIEMLAKGAKVLRGRRFNARASESDLKKWIETM